MSEREDRDEQEYVRRLLAAAGGPEAAGRGDSGPEAGVARVPDDVAARLDDVLAGLVTERAGRAEPPDRADRSDRPGQSSPSAGDAPDAGPSVPGPSVPGPSVPGPSVPGATDLAARRRRRWPQLLAAAAAVSVLGVGLGNVLGDTDAFDGQGAMTAESAGGAADSATQDGVEAHGAKPEVAPRSQESRPDVLVRGTFRHASRLRSGSLTLDVQRIEDFALAVPVASTPRQWARACVQPSVGAGDDWLAVRLDGRPGVLVLRAPDDGHRTAQVYTCGDPDLPAAETVVDTR